MNYFLLNVSLPFIAEFGLYNYISSSRRVCGTSVAAKRQFPSTFRSTNILAKSTSQNFPSPTLKRRKIKELFHIRIISNIHIQRSQKRHIKEKDLFTLSLFKRRYLSKFKHLRPRITRRREKWRKISFQLSDRVLDTANRYIYTQLRRHSLNHFPLISKCDTEGKFSFQRSCCWLIIKKVMTVYRTAEQQSFQFDGGGKKRDEFDIHNYNFLRLH